LSKIRTISKSHIVHPGLEIFKNRKPGQEIKLRKEDIPGLAESGWNPELDAMYVFSQNLWERLADEIVFDNLSEIHIIWSFSSYSMIYNRKIQLGHLKNR
jgi:histone acetyltransferase